MNVGYFSAYYRGLECLLEVWPKIREQVPDAKLNIAYGWESWVAMEGKDAFYHRMEAKFAEMKSQGVTVLGRLNHAELDKLMKNTKVWAYPTQFTEIHCITALKAQAAGCIPVTTNVAALDEVVTTGTKIRSANIYTNEYAQSQFIKAVVKALKDPNPSGVQDDKNWYWPSVATKWLEVIHAGKSK